MTETVQGQPGDIPAAFSRMTFAQAMDSLREALPGWEPRAPQIELAEAIESWIAGQPTAPQDPDMEASNEAVSMFAQAPTGTGKSLAYLIPAISSGKRVVVSVTTKALQDQLAGTDLPFLEQNLMPFTWAVLKGRSSYLCMNRLHDADDHELPQKGQIMAFVAQQEGTPFDGLRESLPFQVTDQQWREISSETEECGGCDADTCFAERARKKARNSTITVVNHALFFSDLNIKVMTGTAEGGMLGDYDMVIADEGHEVREVATGTLAADITGGTFRALTGEIRSWVGQHATEAGEEAITPLLNKLLTQSEAMFRALPGEVFQTKRLLASDIEANAEVLIDVAQTAQDLQEALASATIRSDSDANRGSKRKRTLSARARNLRSRMVAVLTDAFEDTVRWVEIKKNWKGEEVKALRVSPVDISGYLRTSLFDRVPVLIVSATLAVSNKFDFVAGQLGVDRYEGKIVGSPFDFDLQARLYIAGSLPNPSGATQGAWESAVKFEIMELVRAAQGRTLVLFSSIKQMRSIRTYLSEALPYPVKMQGDPGETTESLKRWFLEDVEGVLLGTKSFFTGFDPRGEACSQVIIVKFPFPVPTDPIVQARGEAVEAKGKNSFFNLMIPETSLVVQQMAGRAVRHTTDRAVIAVLDPRAATKPYGQGLMRDLGPIPRAADRAEVAAFHTEIRGHFAALRSA